VTDAFLSLALALAVGLIIGMERGWDKRGEADGSRIAGVRTFALIGLLGGLWQLLTVGSSPLLMGAGLLAVAAVMAAADFAQASVKHNFGVTTVIATLITFVLGALCVQGHQSVAAASAVVVTTLLSLKPVLHGWLERIEELEIRAALKLLLISVVVLPLLPNRGYGPWQTLNPYRLWWMVVLLSAISFAAYVAVKLGGTKHGVLGIGLLGGLMSSTGVTVQLSRLSKQMKRKDMAAAGILVACATMFVRLLVVISFINRAFLAQIVWPFLAMALPLFAAALFFARTKPAAMEPIRLRNPLELAQSVKFAGLLASILLISKAMHEQWGASGLYLAATASGLADVDAITISIAQMNFEEAGRQSATLAAVLATMTNTVTKCGLAGFLGGRELGLRIAIPSAVALICGGVALWIL
jgi:uncharacterized membrane protein (DUF4010 family)